MKAVPLPSALFTLNRERLVNKLLPRSLAVLNANDIMPTNADGAMGHLQNADLFYLTGMHQEETILLLAPDAFDPNHREILFVRQPNEHLAIWEGHKLTKEQATAISGIKNVKWLSEFPVIFRQVICEMENVLSQHQRASARRRDGGDARLAVRPRSAGRNFRCTTTSASRRSCTNCARSNRNTKLTPSRPRAI